MSSYIKGLVDLKEDLDIHKETQSITLSVAKELLVAIPKYEFVVQ